MRASSEARGEVPGPERGDPEAGGRAREAPSRSLPPWIRWWIRCRSG